VLIAGLGVVAVALMIWLQVRDVRRVKRTRRDAVAHAQGHGGRCAHLTGWIGARVGDLIAG
jgi:hypothetical protein